MSGGGAHFEPEPGDLAAETGASGHEFGIVGIQDQPPAGADRVRNLKLCVRQRGNVGDAIAAKVISGDIGQ